MPEGFIPPHGGYKKLKSYRKALIVYDATLYFCERFFSRNRRQTDQMEQAAHSGKQNIAEGSMASATSKQTEILLTNVAYASLGELQEDYEDFLRRNKLPIWDKEHSTAKKITELSLNADENYETYREYIENESPEISANTIRHLTLQAITLLTKQIQRLEKDFLEQGGIRERMTKARLAARFPSSSTSSTSSFPPPALPLCPLCSSPMRLRTAKQGKNAGNQFWGCSKYPECKGTRDFKKEEDGGR